MKRLNDTGGIVSGWAGELFLMTLLGFGLASMVWLGVWFFLLKPAYATTLRQAKDALNAKEVELERYVAANGQLKALNEKIQLENKEITAKLDQALKGWGRCIRSKQSPEENIDIGGTAGTK